MGTTVVDALLVTLGLDTKGFKKGTVEAKKAQENLDKTVEKGKKKRQQTDKEQADAQKKQAKELQKYGKSTEEVFRKVRNEALSTLAVFTGGLGLVAFAKNAIMTSATMYEMTRSMDMSARSIAGWQGAIEQMGGSAGEANATLNGINKAIAEFQNTGNVPGIFHAYQRFGGRQSVWGFTSPEKYIMAASALIHRRMETVGKTAAAGLANQLGFSDNWFYLLSQGPAAVRRRVAQNEANSGVTEASAKEMQRFRQQMRQLDREFQAVAKELMISLNPEFQQLLNGLQNFSKWVTAHQPQIDAFFKDLTDRIAYMLKLGGFVIHPVKSIENATPSQIRGAASDVFNHSLFGLLGGEINSGMKWLLGGNISSIPPSRTWQGAINRSPSVSNSNNRTSTSAHIGEVTIHTGPADANKLADEIRTKWVHMLPQINQGEQ